MLDPLAAGRAGAIRLRRLEGVERPPVGEVADRVDGDRQAGPGAATDDDPRKLLVADDLDAGAVEHRAPSGAERPVQERLDVPEPEQVVPEAGREAEPLEPIELLQRQRLPDAHERLSAPSSRRRWKTRSAPSPPSLSWIAVTPRESASGMPSRPASTISSSAGRT